jgi:hypothetical protein
MRAVTSQKHNVPGWQTSGQIRRRARISFHPNSGSGFGFMLGGLLRHGRRVDEKLGSWNSSRLPFKLNSIRSNGCAAGGGWQPVTWCEDVSLNRRQFETSECVRFGHHRRCGRAFSNGTTSPLSFCDACCLKGHPRGRDVRNT